MAQRDAAGSNFLPIMSVGGFKPFIETWKAGGDMGERLRCLVPELGLAADHTSRIHGLIKGHALLGQAKEWSEPTIGIGALAPMRGSQWRLVIAYAGLEILLKSLMPKSVRGLDAGVLASLFARLELPPCEPCSAPSLDLAGFQVWMEEEDQDVILDFLGMDGGDRNGLRSWMLEQKPAETWVDIVLLAKALRNATAHGALSASKVDEWALNRVFNTLTAALPKVDTAIFQVLGAPILIENGQNKK